MKEINVDSIAAHLFDYKLRKGDIKKYEIIVATIECLAELGIDHTTFDSIAAKLNTKRSHIIYYFKKKDDIYYAAIQYIAATFKEVARQNLEKAKDSKDTLNKYIDGYFLWAKQNPKQLSVMFLLFYMCTHKPRFQEINQQIREVGINTMSHILIHQLELDITPTRARFIAKGMQGIMSAALVDGYSFIQETVNRNKIEKEAKKLCLLLVENA